MLLFNGRITGISGILSGLLTLNPTDKSWRLLFLGGMVLAGGAYQIILPGSFTARPDFPLILLLAGSFIVGFGTRMGGGCTSGHGICGIGRLSMRSIIATMTFMTSGIITVYIIRHLLEIGA